MNIDVEKAVARFDSIKTIRPTTSGVMVSRYIHNSEILGRSFDTTKTLLLLSNLKYFLSVTTIVDLPFPSVPGSASQPHSHSSQWSVEQFVSDF